MASRRRWGAASVIGILVLAIALFVAVLWRPSKTDHRRRSFPIMGISLRTPSEWVDKRGPLDRSVVFELERRLPFGGSASEGMWVARWSPSPDAETELEQWRTFARGSTRRPVVDIDGRVAEVQVDRIGPNVLDRLPLSWLLQRTRYRFEAHGLVYEIGFWDSPGSRSPALQREVLESVRLTPPAERVVRTAGLEFRVPGRWETGVSCTRCWFSSPGQPQAWVYVIDASKPLATDVANTIVGQQGPAAGPFRRTDLDVGGRPAVSVGFTHREPDGGSFEVEDLIIQRANAKVVIVAMGWRSPTGRSELDAVVASLVPAP